MRILALEVGTSSVQAAILDAETAQPAGPIGRCPYELDRPTPDAAEVPADRLWTAIATAARKATRGSEGVDAVGLACLAPALVLLDAADRPVAPIWTHLDRRSRPAARQTWAAVGEEFLANTGNRPLPGGITAVSYRQMVLEDPYLHKKIRSYLHVNGWLGLRLTGERAIDPANACLTGLFASMATPPIPPLPKGRIAGVPPHSKGGIADGWSERWCAFFDVDPAWLPPIVCGSRTVGALRPIIAAELGVPPGIPVKLGTADTSSAILAAGMGAGDLLHTVGTTQVVAALTDQPRPDPKRLTHALGVGGAFIHVVYNPVGGFALDWIRDLCFRDQEEDAFYQQTIPQALARGTRVTLDPPYLGGDRLELEAHRAGFRDLTLSTDRLDLVAAVLEAMRRKHRDALAALGMGETFRRVYLTGGGAETVRRLLPEYQGASVHVLQEGSLRGVARLFCPAPG